MNNTIKMLLAVSVSLLCTLTFAQTTWMHIADEGSAFTVGNAATVRYGAGTQWLQKTMTGAGDCSNTFFGSDPIVNTRKTCEVMSAPLYSACKPTPSSAHSVVVSDPGGVAWWWYQNSTKTQICWFAAPASAWTQQGIDAAKEWVFGRNPGFVLQTPPVPAGDASMLPFRKAINKSWFADIVTYDWIVAPNGTAVDRTAYYVTPAASGVPLKLTSATPVRATVNAKCDCTAPTVLPALMYCTWAAAPASSASGVPVTVCAIKK